jgi:hypothetical protein
MNAENLKNKRENIRTEYTAITSYHNKIVSFRFTLIGLYLAAVGFIMSGNLSLIKLLFLILISSALWIIELRNRSLLNNLCARGMRIEQDYWDYKNDHRFEPFFGHMNKRNLEKPKGLRNKPQFDPDPARIFCTEIESRLISHSMAIDIMFLGIIIIILYLICEKIIYSNILDVLIFIFC